ncbi:hypothetical protein J1N35_037143 [Gossypium stocksii]|uniref:Uncharacterized protein n=1 Tax=Gossypium stocksii TaxID=47602 RepID=A0A9D3UK71_9ROSI|nr:hypothetical protein J1N35_037143 [Gossypium stocksii]
MACSVDHLKKVPTQGFPLMDELYGRQVAEKTHQQAPLRRNQDHYHHHQKLVPHHYVYHGPQAVTVVQQPVTGSYHQIQNNQNHEKCHHVLQDDKVNEIIPFHFYEYVAFQE